MKFQSLILALSLSTFALLSVQSCKEKAAPVSDENLATAADSAGIKYMILPESAVITWEGSKPTGKHTGTIKLASGELFVEKLTLSGGKFVMDMNTIEVTDLEGKDKEDLEGHLKGLTEESADHFFNVAKFPTATYEITSVETGKTNTANTQVNGNLTIKGITKAVAIQCNFNGDQVTVTVESDPIVINRTDFGVQYGSKSIFKDLGDKFIDDNITIKLNFTAKAVAQ